MMRHQLHSGSFMVHHLLLLKTFQVPTIAPAKIAPGSPAPPRPPIGEAIKEILKFQQTVLEARLWQISSPLDLHLFQQLQMNVQHLQELNKVVSVEKIEKLEDGKLDKKIETDFQPPNLQEGLDNVSKQILCW